MKNLFLAFGLLLAGCIHVPSVRTGDHFTTPPPADTLDAAVAAAPPLVDESEIVNLPYHAPAALTQGQPSPFPGALLSPYDAARYRLLDPAADTWRMKAIAMEWQLARTERRDAELLHATEAQVDTLSTQNARARRRRWILFGVGVGLGAAFAGTVTYELR